MMYSVLFSDNKEFKFTKNQIILIPYFNTLINCPSFVEKDIISISSSSIGFEYIHIYATMDEIDIIDPLDKYLFVIKQCDYFCYDKLKILLENKYGYKIDIKDVKENIGKEITIKLKYLMRIKTRIDIIPVYKKYTNNNRGNSSHSYFINNGSQTIQINEDGIQFNSTDTYQTSTSEIHPYYVLHKIFGKYLLQCNNRYESNHSEHIYVKTGNNYYQSCPRIYDTRSVISCCEYFLLSNNNNLYFIEPIYEYPKYSLDDEINDIFKKRYRKKHNIYFTQLIKTILLINKDELICAYIKNSYKLLSEIKEDEYQYIEHIVIKNEPKFNNKCLIRNIEDYIEIYENV